MSLLRVPAPVAMSLQGPDAHIRLCGRRLIFARTLWATLVIPPLGLFVIASILSVPQLNPDKAVRAQMLHPDHPASGYVVSYAHLYGQFGSSLTLIIVLASLASLVWIAVGLVIVWRKSDDWMGLLVAFGLIMLGLGMSPQFYLMNIFSETQMLWRWPIICVDLLGWGSIGLVLILFPNGRFVPGWTRWLIPIWIVYLVAWGLPSDLPFSTAQWPPLLIWVQVSLFLTPIFVQLYRYRHPSSSIERQQTRLVVFAIVITMLADVGFASPLFSFSRSVSTIISVGLYPLALYLFPLAIGIAVLRYRLWDIDVIINRTLVYGVLTVSVVALYILVVVGLGTLFQAQGNLGIALLATGLVAVLFQPVRNWLQSLVNHLMYGERDDPYRVLSRLGQRLEATLAPDAVLPTIVETVVQALKLPYAAIRLQQGEEYHTAASYGSARGELVRLPLVSQSEQVGELVLAPRAAGESFTPADRALLSDLARQVGMAVHAVRLMADLKRFTVDLQRSRELLVTAREEERRRLRRDLHDGLGPQLASLTLKLETARNRLAHDPLADTLLADLAQRTQATVAEIRRLVYALRPPALDELGLVSALCALTLQSSDQVAMHIDAPPCLPELPAAVEVAIYRIAQEALTNVVRHAHAQRCELRLALDEGMGWLSLSIQDDGCGLPPLRPVGIGMTSMRERAEELGGTWSIAQVPTGGTRILTRMPYAHPEKTDTGTVTTSRVPQEEE